MWCYPLWIAWRRRRWMAAARAGQYLSLEATFVAPDPTLPAALRSNPMFPLPSRLLLLSVWASMAERDTRPVSSPTMSLPH